MKVRNKMNEYRIVYYLRGNKIKMSWNIKAINRLDCINTLLSYIRDLGLELYNIVSVRKVSSVSYE